MLKSADGLMVDNVAAMSETDELYATTCWAVQETVMVCPAEAALYTNV